MTSPGAKSKFRFTLLKVSKLLTEDNVKDLAFLCTDIPPARRDKLSKGTDLFTELQGHDLLSEEKVTTLIDWLDEIGLLEASKHLKEYQQGQLTAAIDQPEQRCFGHQELIKHFCVSCESKLCSECVLTSHGPGTNCDVIKLDRISDETTSRRAKLMKEIEGALTHVESAMQHWEKKKTFLQEYREAARKAAHKDFLKLMENAQKRKREVIAQLDSKEISDLKGLMNERKELEVLGEDVHYLEKIVKTSSENNLKELQMISNVTKEISVIKMKAIKQEAAAKEKPVDIVYRKVCNDGTFGVMKVSVLVGGVSLRENQMLNISDERQVNGGVLLVCVDPKDSTKEYWRHAIKVDDDKSPVVMSYRGMWYDNITHALFAVGKTVYVVGPRLLGSQYDSVGSVTPLVINEVPNGSCITSITSCYKPGNAPKQDFLLSISGSSVLREYNVSGSPLRSIETREHVLSSGITCVAYNKNTIAIIGRECDDVILVSANDGTVKQCGSLRPSSVGFLPVIVIWTGSQWLALFISLETETQWKVVNYVESGKLVKVCDEGRASSAVDIPVSVTRLGNTGYVSFHDKVIRAFNLY